ncbi:MAG: class I SAM-dependent methyltransferase [Aureliella sp.]
MLDIGDLTPKPSDRVADWIDASRQRIQLYWDRFKEKPLPQYVECDFELVSCAIERCLDRNIPDGRLFVEWGAGFGVVTGVAGLLGLDAIGIEAEPFLCDEARELFKVHGVPGELWQGNFLPDGASDLADDTDPLVSLTHSIEPAYDAHEIPLSDFSIVFAYPWPGEEHFLRLVFDRFCRPGATMVMYRGPNHVEVYQRR